MADNRVAYGLAKRYGIDTTGMSPKEVWEVLRKKGITEENVSDGAYDSKSDGVKERARKVKINSLSSQEWAIWYKTVADIKKLDYYADKVGKDYIIPIENDNKYKIVITGGTFENPKARKIYSFESSEELEYFIHFIRN